MKIPFKQWVIHIHKSQLFTINNIFIHSMTHCHIHGLTVFFSVDFSIGKPVAVFHSSGAWGSPGDSIFSVGRWFIPKNTILSV